MTTKNPTVSKTSDLATFLNSLGVEDVVDMGEEVRARCFLHEERTGFRENSPRHWFINKRTQQHHCFSCHYSGSLRSLVVDICGGNTWAAAGKLRQFDDERIFEEEHVEVPEIDYENLQLSYVRFPWPTERALKARKTKSLTAKMFGCRWNPEESSWVLPIRGPEAPHPIWGWQEKRADFVLNRPPKVKKSLTLFGIDVMLRGTPTAIVESPLDCLWLYDNQIQAVASFGSEVSDAQMKLLTRTTDTVILALDDDESGIKTTKELIARWDGEFEGGLWIFNYADSPAKDPGECSAEEARFGIENAARLVNWSHRVHRKTPQIPRRSSRSDGRAQVPSRLLSTGTGKNRALDRGGRTPHRRR